MRLKSIILAAGEGTRMCSDIPKVLHKVAGLPIIEWVIRAIKKAGIDEIIMVFGRAFDELNKTYSSYGATVFQSERKGSGHAVMCACDLLGEENGYTLIAAGDMPALTSETIKNMIDLGVNKNPDCVILTAEILNPYGYGRIIRDSITGHVIKIVEEKDATDEERMVKEVNASCYLVKNNILLDALKNLTPNNTQNEYYLTDIIEFIVKGNGHIQTYKTTDISECMGVNDRVQLAEVSRILKDRINLALMRNGVTLIDPKNTYIDPDTKIGNDTIIYPGVIIEDACIIGRKSILYPGSRIVKSIVGENTHIHNSVILQAEIGNNCSIGPNAYIRPNTKIGDYCRIGDFVEIKNSNIGNNTKVSHLTYIGDSDLGKNINIGCGVVFVNYDGKNKYRTTVGDDVFIGCNTNLISPVKVSEGAYIAAGTTVTEHVPENTFVIGRVRQQNKTNWKDKRD